MRSRRWLTRLAVLSVLTASAVSFGARPAAAAVPVTVTHQVTCEADGNRWRIDWTYTNTGEAPLPVTAVLAIPGGGTSVVSGLAEGDQLVPGDNEVVQLVHDFGGTVDLAIQLVVAVDGVPARGLAIVEGRCGDRPRPAATFESQCDGTLLVHAGNPTGVPVDVEVYASSVSYGRHTVPPASTRTFTVPAGVEAEVVAAVPWTSGVVGRGRYELPDACLPPLLGRFNFLAPTSVRYVVDAGPNGLVPTAESPAGAVFDAYDLGSGAVALRSRTSRLFVTATPAGVLAASAPRIAGVAEHFRLVPYADGTVSLQSVANGRWVSAGAGGAERLVADRTQVGATERFGRYAEGTGPRPIRALANGRYVSADPRGPQPLVASRPAANLWEFFHLVEQGGGLVALKSLSNGRWVCADATGTKPLIANRAAVGLWETFRLVANGDGTVSLRAQVNGRYVSAESAGTKPLIANRTAIGPWEKFSLPG